MAPAGAWLRALAYPGDAHPERGQPTRAIAETLAALVEASQHLQLLQMRWTKRSAQRLLDVRTEVLNGTLEDAFRRWYPRVRAAA